MLDYDDISSQMCCFNFKMVFEFTEDKVRRLQTSLTNMPIKMSYEDKIRVKAGTSLNMINIKQLL